MDIASSQSNSSNFFLTPSFASKLAIASQQEIDQKLATGFNVFLLIEPDENKLSDILADLLNPAGKHGQRDQFLRLFLGMLAFSPAHNLADITTVRREAPTGANFNHRRRIDILVDAGALIAIENKVDSPEQPDQARDYLEDLDERAREASAVGAFIYLSPDGRHPGSITKTLRRKHQVTREPALMELSKRDPPLALQLPRSLRIAKDSGLPLKFH